MADDSPFIWHELVTADQGASGEFFCGLFGWTQRRVDAGTFGTYTLFQVNGRDVAGMMNPTPDTPRKGSFWHAYIAVENVDECAQRTSALGGSVLVPPHDVPDVGRICAVADPTGAVAHLMQPTVAQPGRAAISNADRDQESLLERDREWASIAAEGRDVERILAFWSEDAIVVPPGATAIRGKPAIRDYVNNSLAIPGFQIRWRPGSASVSSDGTLGYTTGENAVTVPGADGKLITIAGRYATVWRRDDGNWRCVVDIWNSGP